MSNENKQVASNFIVHLVASMIICWEIATYFPEVKLI